MMLTYVQTVPGALTPDAWATLVAAFIGAAVALVVVIVQRVMDKRDRIQEYEKRSAAVATALLFEIDSHYKSNVRDLLQFFEQHGNDGGETVIKPTSANPFPVYVGNANMLGTLPPVLVEAIVNYYGILRAYIATFNIYSQGYEIYLGGNTPVGRGIMKTLIPRIKTEAVAITQLTYTTCGLLCDFVRTEFSSPRIGVENDPHVQEPTRITLRASRKQLSEEIGRA